MAATSWDKANYVNENGSGTLPSGKNCLVRSRRRRRRSFANVGLGTNLERVVNLRLAVAPVGWRATGSIKPGSLSESGQGVGADLRSDRDSAARRHGWVASADT